MLTYNDLFYDNFELPSEVAELQDAWVFSNALSNYELVTRPGFDNQRCLRVQSYLGEYTRYIERSLTATDYLLVGWRAEHSGFHVQSGYGTHFLRLMSGTTERFGLKITSAAGPVISIRVGGSQVDTLSGYLLTQDAYYEVEAYRHPTDGFIGLYRDGSLIWSMTGDTSALASTMDAVRLSCPSDRASSVNYVYLRDIYVCGLAGWATEGGNNLGVCRVHSAPVDTLVSADFTPSAGSNEDNLPVPHDADTTYNESGTEDHEDRFTVDLTGKPAGNVFAAGIELAAKQSVIGTTEIRSTLSVDSARTTGDKYLLTTAYMVRLSNITQSPGSLGDLDYIGYQNQAGS